MNTQNEKRHNERSIFNCIPRNLAQFQVSGISVEQQSEVHLLHMDENTIWPNLDQNPSNKV
jgi:hypothetical protein